MKILLTTLNSKYIHSNLSIRYLYMAALEYRRNIDIKEFTVNNDDNYIYTEIVRGGYDVICFSCYIWNVERTVKIAESLKKALPEVKILFGGPEVSFDYIAFMSKYKFVDFIIRGEGEEAFKNFVRTSVCGEDDFEHIKGLLYRKDGKIYVNPENEMADFAEIPFPYGFLQPSNNKIVYYETSRGCPFSCTYCLSSIEKSVRTLPLERVEKEISYFLRHRITQVKFIDRTFNYDAKRANKIIEYIILHDNGKTNFHFEICGELIDDEFVRLMKSARQGLFQLEIGIQSTNVEALSAVNRSTNVQKLLANIAKLTAIDGLNVHLDLIAGLPYEDYSSFVNSFNEVYALGANQLQLGFLKLLKGTSLRSDKKKFGYVFRDVAPYELISSKFISAEGIARLKMVENVLDMYYNKGGFTQTLKYSIEVFSGQAFDFYEQFAYFFYLKGYQHKSHKKEDLYRIFYEYACWKDKSLPGLAQIVKEKLSTDMADFLNPEVVKRFEKVGWEL